MTLGEFLIAHGSALILPLAVIEGPFVSILSGFLSAQGYLDWAWALSLLICGDLIGDLLYYWVGRSGKTGLVRLLRRFGVRADVAPDMQRHLTEHATKMLLIGKWTQSVGCVVLIGSGMLRLPLARFILVNLLATVPKVALLFAVGYFAGHHFGQLEQHALLTSIVLGLVGAGALALVVCRSHVFRAGDAGQ